MAFMTVGAAADLHPVQTAPGLLPDSLQITAGGYFLICLVVLQSVVIALFLLKMRQRRRAERILQQEQQLKEGMYRTLELRIRDEAEKSREKDRIMLQQSRFAAMGEMIGNIAHQWRQPLNMLGLLIQQIQMEQEKGVLTDRLMDERVGKAMDLLLCLSKTIDDFRNFFGPELEEAPFHLSQVIIKTVGFFEPSCHDHNIKVTIEGESGQVFTGHANEFSQVLLNILNNARDALVENAPANPWISIRMSEDQRRSVITIADNAGGIDAGILEKIFDPYFTTKEEGKGTGVGLYLAKSIINRNMQGQIYVRNLAEGAEFTIII